MQKNTLETFTFEQLQIQLFSDDDGNPWFLAHEVCAILEIKNSRQAVTRLSEQDLSTVIINDSKTNNPNRTLINEFGLYDLVMVSRTEKAKRFKYWITHEVLPQIRKTGSYNQLPADPAKQALMLAEQLIASNKRVLELETDVDLGRLTIQEFQPKVDYCDIVRNKEGNIMLSIWWQEVKGEKKWNGNVFDVFYYKGWLTKKGGRRVPHSSVLNKHLTLKHTDITKPNGTIHKSPTVFITPEGKLYFAERLGLINNQPDLFGEVK